MTSSADSATQHTSGPETPQINVNLVRYDPYTWAIALGDKGTSSCLVYGPAFNSSQEVHRPLSLVDNCPNQPANCEYLNMFSIDANEGHTLREALLRGPGIKSNPMTPKYSILRFWDELEVNNVISRDQHFAGHQVMQACGLQALPSSAQGYRKPR